MDAAWGCCIMGFWEGPILDDIIALGGLDTRPKAGSGCCPIPYKNKTEEIKMPKCLLLRISDFCSSFMFFFFFLKRGRVEVISIRYRVL